MMLVVSFADFLPYICFGIGVVFILFAISRGGATYVEYDESETVDEDIYNQRVNLFVHSVDLIWNCLGLSTMMEGDENPKLNTTIVYTSPTEILVLSEYDKRAIKMTATLNWKTQTMFVRVEQSFSGWYISVERTVKIKGYEISLIQANKIATAYYKDVDVITRQLEKDAVKAEKQNKEVEKEDRKEKE